MKRAQPHKIGAALFQLYVAAHNVYDIGACQKLLDEGLRYCHDDILTCHATAGAAVKKPARGGLFKTQCGNLFCWHLFYWFFAFLWLGSCVVHGVSLRVEGVKNSDLENRYQLLLRYRIAS